MATRFAVIGLVSVLGAGAIMHHARFCPLQKMMAAMHHRNASAVVVTKQARASALASATVAFIPAKTTVLVAMK